eukprot:gene10053-7948_t
MLEFDTLDLSVWDTGFQVADNIRSLKFNCLVKNSESSPTPGASKKKVVQQMDTKLILRLFSLPFSRNGGFVTEYNSTGMCEDRSNGDVYCVSEYGFLRGQDARSNSAAILFNFPTFTPSSVECNATFFMDLNLTGNSFIFTTGIFDWLQAEPDFYSIEDFSKLKIGFPVVDEIQSLIFSCRFSQAANTSLYQVESMVARIKDASRVPLIKLRLYSLSFDKNGGAIVDYDCAQSCTTTPDDVTYCESKYVFLRGMDNRADSTEPAAQSPPATPGEPTFSRCSWSPPAANSTCTSIPRRAYRRYSDYPNYPPVPGVPQQPAAQATGIPRRTYLSRCPWSPPSSQQHRHRHTPESLPTFTLTTPNYPPVPGVPQEPAAQAPAYPGEPTSPGTPRSPVYENPDPPFPPPPTALTRGNVLCTATLYEDLNFAGSEYVFSSGAFDWDTSTFSIPIFDFSELTESWTVNDNVQSLRFVCSVNTATGATEVEALNMVNYITLGKGIKLRLFSLPIPASGGARTDYVLDTCQLIFPGRYACIANVPFLRGMDNRASAAAIMFNDNL